VLLHGGGVLFGVHTPPLGGVAVAVFVTVAGGVAICDRVDAVGGDVFRRRPTLGTRDWARMTLSVLAR